MIAAFAIGAIALVVAVHPVEAELENHVFTSRADRIRLVVPRGWRESDAPSYPGVLLWLMRPETKIVLTAEPFTRALYCSWPITCRASHEITTVEAKLACALRQKLVDERMHIGPIQEGPKENEAAGLASVWFDYDDGKHFLRQAIAFSPDDYAISLVLSAGSKEARAIHGRAFEQALRTLHVVTPEETARAEGIDAAVAPPSDASIIDSTALVDGAVLDAGVLFESAPAPKVNPIGPCDKR